VQAERKNKKKAKFFCFSARLALSSRPIMKKGAAFVATIGVFDGVHLGHRFLLNKVREAADTRGMSALAVTFDPTPAEVWGREAEDSAYAALLTLEERRERLLAAGMDRVEVLPFSREIAAWTASRFMRMLHERFGVEVLVMGYDHRFGCEQRRDAAFYDQAAEALGMEVVHATAYGHVSSTRIREALRLGDVATAGTLLGYPYALRGTVVPGDRRGRTLGFPTANLSIPPTRLVPASGVYAVRVELEGRTYAGMMNIGLCPTFGGRTTLRAEVHILDFNADIYGQTLTVTFRERLRDECRFPSVEALVAQLRRDAEACRRMSDG